MKVLIASTPATGHLNQLLAVGRALVSDGHEVMGLCTLAVRDLIEASGASFRSFPQAAECDLRKIDTPFPGITDIRPGPEQLLFIVKRAFVDVIPAQHESIQQAAGLSGRRHPGRRPPLRRTAHAARPAIRASAGRHARHDAVASEPRLHGPVLRSVAASERRAAGIAPDGLPAPPRGVPRPHRRRARTLPGADGGRPAEHDHVRYDGTALGCLPAVDRPGFANKAWLPDWADDLDDSRRVVLVTQGTVSNHDFSELIAPTLAALADEPDLLVVATAGGRSSTAIPGPIPDNARVADYLPLEKLLPRVDALVTNDGYGTANQALGHGIPLVAAGLSEDKPDVCARVAWSGAGIDLHTSTPAPDAIRAAVRRVLNEPVYRMRAGALAAEFAKFDTTAEILGVLSELSDEPVHANSAAAQ